MLHLVILVYKASPIYFDIHRNALCVTQADPLQYLFTKYYLGYCCEVVTNSYYG
jgi:hypothetical protein